MKTLHKPSPPTGLSPEAKGWWTRLQTEFGIEDPAGLMILGSAAEALTRMRQAQAVIAKEGLVLQDRFGQSVAHPATRIERDGRAQMLACLRELHLDVEPVRRPGRPDGTRFTVI
jgi:P27 family predicted phage terminase small subunit